MNEQRNSNNADKSKSTYNVGHYRPIRRVNPTYIDKLNNKSQPNRAKPKPSSLPIKSSSNIKPAQKPKARSKILIVLNLLLIISLVTGLVLLYIKYLESQAMVSKLSTPQGQHEFNKQELDTILADMQRLVELPLDEEPSMATVVDANKINKLEFYKNAHKGDRVIVYNVAKKRYLYRPNTKTIINAGSFESNPTAQ